MENQILQPCWVLFTCGTKQECQADSLSNMLCISPAFCLRSLCFFVSTVRFTSNNNHTKKEDAKIRFSILAKNLVESRQGISYVFSKWKNVWFCFSSPICIQSQAKGAFWREHEATQNEDINLYIKSFLPISFSINLDITNALATFVSQSCIKCATSKIASLVSTPTCFPHGASCIC